LVAGGVYRAFVNGFDNGFGANAFGNVAIGARQSGKLTLTIANKRNTGFGGIG